MREQAEDVMGSLLKEYLKGTNKEGEILSNTNGSDGISNASKESEEIPGASEKNEETPGTSEKCEEIQGASEKSDEVPATGERNALLDDKEQDPVVNHVPENDASVLKTSENASEENGGQLNRWNPESGTKQFKNVVAIVDPPRGGLHPIVSIILFYITSGAFSHQKACSLFNAKLIIGLLDVLKSYPIGDFSCAKFLFPSNC